MSGPFPPIAAERASRVEEVRRLVRMSMLTTAGDATRAARLAELCSDPKLFHVAWRERRRVELTRITDFVGRGSLSLPGGSGCRDMGDAFADVGKPPPGVITPDLGSWVCCVPDRSLPGLGLCSECSRDRDHRP